uniref:Bro c n=1 Tax=Spodoptera frugiperda granulovirus TaxID=307454 RepID=A0A346QVX9_9BBAC|nr:bro c [Spodoptera frugiperda granulovirus]
MRKIFTKLKGTNKYNMCPHYMCKPNKVHMYTLYTNENRKLYTFRVLSDGEHWSDAFAFIKAFPEWSLDVVTSEHRLTFAELQSAYNVEMGDVEIPNDRPMVDSTGLHQMLVAAGTNKKEFNAWLRKQTNCFLLFNHHRTKLIHYHDTMQTTEPSNFKTIDILEKEFVYNGCVVKMVRVLVGPNEWFFANPIMNMLGDQIVYDVMNIRSAGQVCKSQDLLNTLAEFGIYKTSMLVTRTGLLTMVERYAELQNWINTVVFNAMSRPVYMMQKSQLMFNKISVELYYVVTDNGQDFWCRIKDVLDLMKYNTHTIQLSTYVSSMNLRTYQQLIKAPYNVQLPYHIPISYNTTFINRAGLNELARNLFSPQATEVMRWAINVLVPHMLRTTDTKEEVRDFTTTTTTTEDCSTQQEVFTQDFTQQTITEDCSTQQEVFTQVFDFFKEETEQFTQGYTQTQQVEETEQSTTQTQQVEKTEQTQQLEEAEQFIQDYTQEVVDEQFTQDYVDEVVVITDDDPIPVATITDPTTTTTTTTTITTDSVITNTVSTNSSTCPITLTTEQRVSNLLALLDEKMSQLKKVSELSERVDKLEKLMEHRKRQYDDDDDYIFVYRTNNYLYCIMGSKAYVMIKKRQLSRGSYDTVLTMRKTSNAQECWNAIKAAAITKYGNLSLNITSPRSTKIWLPTEEFAEDFAKEIKKQFNRGRL